ncbi:hypothetical protein [Metabacillus kandeliae]|nr:hypothetical protein [Metabacillus kandeliae]
MNSHWITPEEMERKKQLKSKMVTVAAVIICIGIVAIGTILFHKM